MTPSRFWIALAFVSALSMLPVYHRHHDAKLLMLAIPGCALVWARRRPSGILGILVTSLAIAFNADIPRVILAHFESTISLSDSAISGRVMTIFGRPAPLVLLLRDCLLSLCVYATSEEHAEASNPISLSPYPADAFSSAK